MKKLTFKGTMNTLKGAAMDGAVIYAGRTSYRIVDKQVGNLLPAAIPVAFHGAVVGTIGVVLGDLVLPKKYATLFGAAMASEVIEAFVAPTIEPMLIKAGLVYNLPAGSTAGYGQMKGYGAMRGIAGMASLRPRMATATSYTGN